MEISLPKPMAESAHVLAARSSLEKAWQKRRPWSRTDTARFLDDRSATCWALLRRRPGRWPREPGHFGRWLQVNSPKIFLAAHAKLLAAPSDEARAELIPSELL